MYPPITLNVNPIVCTLVVKPRGLVLKPSTTTHLIHLLRKFSKNKSIFLKSPHDLNELDASLFYHSGTYQANQLVLKFESTDATFLSKLTAIRFPQTVTVTCRVQHIGLDNITSYTTRIDRHNARCFDFDTRPLTAKTLRKLFSNSDFYDQNDFLNELENAELDELDEPKRIRFTPKIYKDKTQFIEKEVSCYG